MTPTLTTSLHTLDINGILDCAGQWLTTIADALCGYPLFVLLIGGGLFLMCYSGFTSLRRLPHSIRVLRTKQSADGKATGQISSLQALASAVSATIGMGNIAGVAIALMMGGPGAIFWMWMSALVGMSTKYHEGVLAIKYKGRDRDGNPQGGTMHIIERGLGRKWKPLAITFAFAGMLGTLCILNANQLTEALVAGVWDGADTVSLRFAIGVAIATVVALVVLGGIRRIAKVASYLVPFMVALYFALVSYIIVTHIQDVPGVIASIFTEAFNLRAGWGALAGIAIIGARRAAFVNDAGIGTATIMHGASRNTEPVKEGLVAMLGPAIDSGLVCTLTALAILLCGDISSGQVQGLTVAMQAFRTAIPYGDMFLLTIVLCFAMSSMFSYSFYGFTCASYLWGRRKARWYTYFFILSLILFAIVPLKAAVGLCDLFYAFMAFHTMLALILLRKKVKEETRRYFNKTSTTPNTSPI